MRSSRAGPSGAVYRREADGRVLTSEHSATGYRDRETQSEWSLGGRAVAGPLKGAVLQPVPSRFMFWFAWVSAFPGTEVRGL